MNDPYQTLGVSKTASADEIKKAYRKLAKKLHPDMNPGDKKVEARFKDATAAYDLLSDTEKRARFDRGEIDAAGNERPEFAFRRAHAGGGFGQRPGGMGGGGMGGGGFEAQDMFGEDILDALLRGGRGGRRARKGSDVKVQLRVPFLTAANGGSVRVTLPGGRTVDLKIPAGASEGQVLRLSGQGEAAGPGGTAGDALVELRIDAHPLFRREGNDIHADLPITLSEAVLGGRIAVPTVDGKVMLNIPANSTGRNTLRLRGKGLAGEGGTRGDQYVHLRITLPEGTADEALRAFAENWASQRPYDPRAGLV